MPLVDDDPLLSRYHIELTVKAGGATQLLDLRSTNGTFLNGRRIGSAVLAESDTVRIGSTTLKLSRRREGQPSPKADPVRSKPTG